MSLPEVKEPQCGIVGHNILQQTVHECPPDTHSSDSQHVKAGVLLVTGISRCRHLPVDTAWVCNSAHTLPSNPQAIGQQLDSAPINVPMEMHLLL
jgi:hypothetical protein